MTKRMCWRTAVGFLLCGALLVSPPPAAADEDVPPQEQFLQFIREQAQTLRAGDRPPATKEEWLARRAEIRQRLEEAWGEFPAEPCPLEPRKLAELDGDGYRVEKLLLQTMPGVWMTALAYVPDAPGPHPAILNVHGHWKHAKVEPLIQSRCIGAAKLGFFVLAVDAFGAGERGIGEALGEYHGEMAGATLFPIGRPLSGIQVYENMRAVDYLQSRPEVHRERIGVTGASGGGNQSMYAGAWDERLGAAVPVCSVGNYHAYLGAACCMCEVVPGALTFTDEWGVLGLTAPRALMPCNVTRDAFQFSIREARKSVAGAQHVYDLLGAPDALYHATFRWNHDYHQPIREAMYGWMTQHLKGEGDGSPIPEPAHTTLDPEQLRCYPGETRPDDWLTLPQFAGREARALVGRQVWTESADSAAWVARRESLINQVLGGFPPDVPLDMTSVREEPASRTLSFVSEPGIRLVLQHDRTQTVEDGTAAKDVVVLLSLEGGAAARQSALAAALREQGAELVTLDLRATGAFARPNDRIGRAPDHNTAEWALWIGRPLLGQWTWDVRRAIAAAMERRTGEKALRIHVVGLGDAGLVALCVAATDARVQTAVAVDTLAGYVTDVPYEQHRLGILAPGILRDIGDVPHLAALALPQRVIIAGGVDGTGQPLSAGALASQWGTTRAAAASLGKAGQFVLHDTSEPAPLAAAVLAAD